MRKLILLTIVALMACATGFAQSSVELAKQQKELNSINMRLLQIKPSKAAKKQAKKLRKEGWMVTGSDKPIELQITSDQLLAEELMADENGKPTKRYIQHSASAVQGTQKAAYADARAACQIEIAAMIETKIAGALLQRVDGIQSSSIDSTTVDKFQQRAKGVFDTVITNVIPGLNIYRQLSNNNYEVQVTLSFDKKQIAIQLKKELLKQLEMEGNAELNSIIDQALQEM